MAFRWRADDGAFRWRADDDPVFSGIKILSPSLPEKKNKNKTNKKTSELDPLWQNFLDPRMRVYLLCVGLYFPILCFQKRCRRWYCSPGDMNTMCTCEPLPILLSGMPVIVKIKIRPATSKPLKSSGAILRKMRKQIENLFTTYYASFSAKTITTFKSNQKNPYHIHVLEIKAKPGLDTKVELKEIVEIQDKVPIFEFEMGKTTLQAFVTDHVQIWIDHASRSILAKDILTLETLEQTFIDATFKLFRSPSQIMEAKKILYCRQAQLNSEEFSDVGGVVTLNVNPKAFIGLNYIYAGEYKKVRVCIEDYLPPAHASSAVCKDKVMKLLLITMVLLSL